MVLTGKEIKQRLLRDKDYESGISFDSKLIIAPILDMESQLKEDSASIDLRLGENFVFFNKTKLSHTDPGAKEYNKREALLTKEYKIVQKVILHPNQFVLGETLEWVRLPNDLAGLLTAKSSDARDGLQIETANLIHPRFSGTITLELKNNGEVPIVLYPGLTVGQLTLFKLSEEIKNITAISKSTFKVSIMPYVSTKIKKDIDIVKKFEHLY